MLFRCGCGCRALFGSVQTAATLSMDFFVQRPEYCSVCPGPWCTPGSRFSGLSAYDRSVHSRPVASLSLLMNHADGSDHPLHRCLFLVTPSDHLLQAQRVGCYMTSQDWSKIFCRLLRSFWSELAFIGLPSWRGCRGRFKKTLLSHQA